MPQRINEYSRYRYMLVPSLLYKRKLGEDAIKFKYREGLTYSLDSRDNRFMSPADPADDRLTWVKLFLPFVSVLGPLRWSFSCDSTPSSSLAIMPVLMYFRAWSAAYLINAIMS